MTKSEYSPTRFKTLSHRNTAPGDTLSYSDPSGISLLSFPFKLLEIIFSLHSVFHGKVSLSIFSCPKTTPIDPAGLELSKIDSSASQVLGIKACGTMAQLSLLLL